MMGRECAPVPPHEQLLHLFPLFNVVEELQDAVVESFGIR
jgi:hypothetical protein